VGLQQGVREGVCVAVCRLFLLQHLQQLGVKVPFDKSKADFSRLSPEALFISDVLQSVSGWTPGV